MHLGRGCARKEKHSHPSPTQSSARGNEISSGLTGHPAPSQIGSLSVWHPPSSAPTPLGILYAPQSLRRRLSVCQRLAHSVVASPGRTPCRAPSIGRGDGGRRGCLAATITTCTALARVLEFAPVAVPAPVSGGRDDDEPFTPEPSVRDGGREVNGEEPCTVEPSADRNSPVILTLSNTREQPGGGAQGQEADNTRVAGPMDTLLKRTSAKVTVHIRASAGAADGRSRESAAGVSLPGQAACDDVPPELDDPSSIEPVRW